MKPLRIAVLGAGLIGRRHIDTILAMPEAAELAAVSDPVVDPGQYDLKGAPWFTDEVEMLDRVKPEAVVIATPNGLHLRHGEACCRRGIHFLMEKPVTATLGEAAQLVRLVADRLWLVEDGTVRNFDGDVDDYRDYVLAQRQEERRAQRAAKAEEIGRAHV